MNFREFANLERTDEPVLNDQQFRAVLVAAKMWFETQQPKRRRRRGRPVVQVEPDAAPYFDLAELR